MIQPVYYDDITPERTPGFYRSLQAMGKLPVVALSIQQPWAWLMTAAPPPMLKKIENRTWRRKTPEHILVHTGLKVDQVAHRSLIHGRHPVSGKIWLTGGYNPYLEAFNAGQVRTGGFVGAMDFTGEVLTESGDPWFMGPYGYVTANARALPFLPWRGMLGFFDAKVSA
jgi:hypothetical protein